MLSYKQFREEGELLVRRSHERARRAAQGEEVATWEWRHGAWAHLDGNSFLVSVGNVRYIEREEQQTAALVEPVDGDDVDGWMQPTDEEAACVLTPPALPTASSLPTTEPVLLELHIVFHATYQTPALYFRAATVDGAPVNTERILRGVQFAGRSEQSPVVASLEQHPVLGMPVSLLHPCETAAAMELLLSQSATHERSESEAEIGDRVPTHLASWLSLVQPLTGISPMGYYAVE